MNIYVIVDIICSMKKINLIKNPTLFQGKKQLEKNKKYFEGWYYKISNENGGISFIPGVCINETGKKSFIQIITNDNSYYVDYDIRNFEFSHNPFYIKIGNNFFSEEKISININDKTQSLKVIGNIEYSCSKNITNSSLSPNIMGIFSYVPGMECNHAIISMKSKCSGEININDEKIKFSSDIGYIEKDWGTSFPEYYIWCQGNNFKNKEASFMVSVANIPFKLLRFRGVICSLLIGNKEYRFATYNGVKVIKYNVNDQCVDIILKRKNYELSLKANIMKGSNLIAPVKGKMEKEIIESINSLIEINLKENGKIIFSDVSKNCGLEIVSK